MRRLLGLSMTLALAASALGPPVALAAPPDNDNFASATVIGSLPFAASDVTLDATSEQGEPTPTCYSIYRSVWYVYTPSQDQVVRLNYGQYAQSLQVYRQTGSGFGGLVPVSCMAWEWDGTRLLKLQGGATYVFQAGEGYDYYANMSLSLTEVQPPPNDEFSAIATISALPFEASDPTRNATTEQGEPSSGSIYRTVWYGYTPADDQLVRLVYGPYWQSLGVYSDSGSGLPGLVPVDRLDNGDTTLLQLKAGTTYVFQVGQREDVDHVMSLKLSEIVPPPNDNWANAAAFTSLPFSRAGNGRLATFETGEPWTSCLASQQTVWYAFTPTESGWVTGRADNGSLAAYVGSSVTTLSEVATECGIGSPLTFHADAGTTYYVQLGVFQYGGIMDYGFSIDVAPPLQAYAWADRSDPSIFDTVRFYGQTYDPVYSPIATWAWTFGDGSTSADQYPTHRYLADGDYTVSLTATATDGRTASASFVVAVRTHDVAITELTVPKSGKVGKTATVSVSVSNKWYAETVTLDLFRSAATGYEAIGQQTIPISVSKKKKVTTYSFSYEFTAADAAIGKVSFKVTATVSGARDAYPIDNEAVATTPKVTAK
jgi:hypothetical protein